MCVRRIQRRVSGDDQRCEVIICSLQGPVPAPPLLGRWACLDVRVEVPERPALLHSMIPPAMDLKGLAAGDDGLREPVSIERGQGGSVKRRSQALRALLTLHR